MRVNIAQATPPSVSHNNFSSSLQLKRSQSTIFASNVKILSPKSTSQSLRRSCSASFETHDIKKHHQNELNFPTMAAFKHPGSQVEVLEPSYLGIRPEPPDWPARDELIRESIARRAASIELPLSLRMIKMKQRFKRLEEEIESWDLEFNHDFNDPITNLCCSTLYIIKEVQSYGFKIRGLVLGGDLDGVVGKVQKEMTSSFVWLFREVFAKTPDLMLQVMVLTSDFAISSIETVLLEEKKTQVVEIEDEFCGVIDDGEVGLWNSMVEEVNEMKGGFKMDEGLRFVVDYDDHGLMDFRFVSPVRVDIEGDDYEEYDRTDLLYRIGLSQEPNSTLLLANYAQFLYLVSRDYDRAEECFKRAIQLDQTDAEVISQYANFLWLVRKDIWGAEERFQQAIAAEPSNPYHASKYASFLWSSGGEDTSYPLDPPVKS